MTGEALEAAGGIWCVVANIKRERRLAKVVLKRNRVHGNFVAAQRSTSAAVMLGLATALCALGFIAIAVDS